MKLRASLILVIVIFLADLCYREAPNMALKQTDFLQLPVVDKPPSTALAVLTVGGDNYTLSTILRSYPSGRDGLDAQIATNIDILMQECRRRHSVAETMEDYSTLQWERGVTSR